MSKKLNSWMGLVLGTLMFITTTMPALAGPGPRGCTGNPCQKALCVAERQTGRPHRLPAGAHVVERGWTWLGNTRMPVLACSAEPIEVSPETREPLGQPLSAHPHSSTPAPTIIPADRYIIDMRQRTDEYHARREEDLRKERERSAAEAARADRAEEESAATAEGLAQVRSEIAALRAQVLLAKPPPQQEEERKKGRAEAEALYKQLCAGTQGPTFEVICRSLKRRMEEG